MKIQMHEQVLILFRFKLRVAITFKINIVCIDFLNWKSIEYNSTFHVNILV